MNPIVEKVYQIGIIPVIAFNSVDEALPLCKALAEGGLPAAEVTFRTACAEECIRKIHEEMPEMLLGVMVYSWRKAPFQHSVNEKESLYAKT